MKVSWAYPLFLIALLALPLLWITIRGRRTWRARAIACCRASELALILLALAGTRIERAADRVASIFAFDLSRSVPPDRREKSLAFAKEAVGSMAAADEAGVIAFGGEALVEALPQARLTVKPLASSPSADSTDLAGAIRLASGLYPAGALKRLVLFTDGNENRGDALEALRAAGPSGLTIDAVAIEAPPRREVSLSRLDLPARVEKNEPFELRAEALASAPGPALLRFFRDGAPIGREEVQLREGRNTFSVTWSEELPGFHTYEAMIESESDTQTENNRAMGLTQIAGPSRVLLVGSDADNGLLLSSLRGTQLDVQPARELPEGMAAIQAYDAVVLNNISADQMTTEGIEALERYVRDLGGGLVMVGGEGSFGPGGWIGTAVERALPVRMEIKSREEFPSLGLVLVIDKSGSMGGEIPGVSKMDIAKRAASEAFKLLGPRDLAGVVVFDSDASWAVRLGPSADNSAAEGLIRAIEPGGGTDIYQGLVAAVDSLIGSDARLKHIILLTDGQTPAANFAALTERMKNAKITLSAVGIGTDADEPFLAGLASAGGGRFYACHDPSRVPRVFVRETVLVQRSYIREEEAVPARGASSSILDAAELSAFPALRGWVSTEPKERAEVALTVKSDPLLTTWEYGLGRSVAFTSDATGRWSRDWTAWGGFGAFWERAIRSCLRAVPAADLHPRLVTEGGRGRLVVELEEPAGGAPAAPVLGARVLGPDLQPREVALRQTSSGRYEASFDAAQPGAYFAAVQREGGGSASAGGMVAFSPEFKDFKSNQYLLNELTRRTGGRLNPAPSEIFRKEGQPAEAPREIPLPLLLAAMALLLAEVALRRLSFEREDWAWMMAWPARLNPLRLRTASLQLDLNAEQKEELVVRSQEVRRGLRTGEGKTETLERLTAAIQRDETERGSQPSPSKAAPQEAIVTETKAAEPPPKQTSPPPVIQAPKSEPIRKSIWGKEEDTIDTSESMAALVARKKKRKEE